MKNVDLVIIGGGPAGLAAAVEARKHGVQDLLVLERDNELGGILNQCIHLSLIHIPSPRELSTYRMPYSA